MGGSATIFDQPLLLVTVPTHGEKKVILGSWGGHRLRVTPSKGGGLHIIGSQRVSREKVSEVLG